MFIIIDHPNTAPSAHQVENTSPPADEALHPLLEEPKLYETGAEVFADEGDLASLREEQANADAVRRAMAAAKVPLPPASFDGEHCVECEDDLPAKRLEMGYFRCVPCQTLRERQGKHG